MAKLSVDQIRDIAVDIISSHPGGIRYAELFKEISKRGLETPRATINRAIWDLAIRVPQRVVKPDRGLWMPVEPCESQISPPIQPPSHREQSYYLPFAEWLTSDLDEATVAVPLGGAAIGTKWGTPDVVGVYKPLASQRIKFAIEIVSAEIKIDPQSPVIAFGQAVAYRLFSSKCYVVMPATITERDLSRLEALCMLFGIGLVLFESNPEAPNFRIRVRAQRFSPDMFYVNEFAERLFQIDPKMFNELFG